MKRVREKSRRKGGQRKMEKDGGKEGGIQVDNSRTRDIQYTHNTQRSRGGRNRERAGKRSTERWRRGEERREERRGVERDGGEKRGGGEGRARSTGRWRGEEGGS